MDNPTMIVLDKDAIGARLRAVRKNANVTQEQIAEASGVNQRTISGWESGGIPGALPEFSKVALVLGQTPDTLLLEEAALSVVSKQRSQATQQTADNLLELTELVVKHDAIARRRRTELPSKILLDQARWADRISQSPAASPVHGSGESAETPQQEEVGEALLELTEHLTTLAVGSKAHHAVELAVTALDRQYAALKSSARKASGKKAPGGDAPPPKPGKAILRLHDDRKKSDS